MLAAAALGALGAQLEQLQAAKQDWFVGGAARAAAAAASAPAAGDKQARVRAAEASPEI